MSVYVIQYKTIEPQNNDHWSVFHKDGDICHTIIYKRK